MQAIYEVPVIPNNLRHEETIVQIADALNYLSNVLDDIVLRVNTRITENKNRVSNLTERINKSSEKIVKLTGTKKATQVFSSSKYPASDVHKRYKSIFTHTKDKSVNFTRTKIKFKDSGLTDQPLEKLQFYHVKISDKFKRNTNNINIEEGLGTFPNDIGSVNELLLFNTSKNPYKNYVMSDPLQAIQHTKEADVITAPGPDAAPLSISQRTGLNRSVGENYFYSPGMGDVPSIDVPLDLPDLPGVADDLRYLMESGPAIAPSVTTTPIAPELPSIVQSPVEIPPNELNPVITEPLPPLPTPVTLPVEISPTAISKPPDSSQTFVVPLPIPVPEELVPPVEKKEIKEKTLPPVEDARASLMAAIRQAGGAKKANLRNTEPKNEDKSFASMGGGNLMADLNAKLALRRKGISGSKASDVPEMSSALSRVSAMIPPPVQNNSDLTESTTTEDDDWDE